jgi:hypothetical protein
MTATIIGAKELAHELGVSEIDLQHIAHERRLPFSFSSAFGFFTHCRDLPQWRDAVAPVEARNACCGD